MIYNENYDNDYNMTELEYQEFKELMFNKYDIYITRRIVNFNEDTQID